MENSLKICVDVGFEKVRLEYKIFYFWNLFFHNESTMFFMCIWSSTSLSITQGHQPCRSSEIRDLYLMKSFTKTLQNLPYFWHTKNPWSHFSFGVSIDVLLEYFFKHILFLKSDNKRWVKFLRPVPQTSEGHQLLGGSRKQFFNDGDASRCII